MQLNASYIGPNYDKLWFSDYTRHVEKMNNIISKTVKKPPKLRSVRSEAKYQNKSNEWNQKFNNHQLYLKLMQIATDKKHNQSICYTDDDARQRMINNMEMARRREQIKINIQNGNIAKRIEQASERTHISELFADHRSYASLPKKKFKHKKQRNKKKSLMQLPSIKYVQNS